MHERLLILVRLPVDGGAWVWIMMKCLCVRVLRETSCEVAYCLDGEVTKEVYLLHEVTQGLGLWPAISTDGFPETSPPKLWPQDVVTPCLSINKSYPQ